MPFDFALTLGIGTLIGIALNVVNKIRKLKQANIVNGKAIAKILVKDLRALVKRHMESFIDITIEKLIDNIVELCKTNDNTGVVVSEPAS
jgi:predicted MarR family transcription regulator